MPLPQVVLDELARHIADFPPTGRDGLLFTNRLGQPIRRTSLWKICQERSTRRVSMTFHGLRHYYASLLIRHGESVKTVQERLGHASAVETLDTYSHLWPDSDDRTRDAVEGVLGAGLADYVRTSALGG